MNEIKIKVVNREEFRKLLLEQLILQVEGWTMENIYNFLLDNGFNKLDFDRLNESLKDLFIYLPTIAVDFGDSKFVWMVSGTNAMLVDKTQP